ncbi:hypothetical protein RRG08_047777 [Elysia crispata]|uniref:Uncharacterized protein n=1 Tax=Elysia crispata TaxID=231223 RepID=A0AAE0YX85_9GAST|nr:hypothetical protein RRG08_047777 [Elysia crispata]
MPTCRFYLYAVSERRAHPAIILHTFTSCCPCFMHDRPTANLGFSNPTRPLVSHLTRSTYYIFPSSPKPAVLAPLARILLAEHRRTETAN